MSIQRYIVKIVNLKHSSAELFSLFTNAAAGVPGGGAGHCNVSCTADTDSVKSPAAVTSKVFKTLRYLCLVDKNLHSAQ